MSFLLEFVCCAFFTIIPLTMCRLVQFQLRQTISNLQCAEINYDKILNNIHKTYIGLTRMLQGFQKCIA